MKVIDVSEFDELCNVPRLEPSKQQTIEDCPPYTVFWFGLVGK